MDAERVAAEYTDNIDVLLTDIVMPGRRGPELATHLRSVRPMLRVVYMSGFIDTEPLDSEGVEPARVVIAGDSAGGGLAVAPDAVTPRASPPDAGGLRRPLTLGRPRLHGREHDHPRGRGLHGHA